MYKNYFNRESTILTPKFERNGNSMTYLVKEKNNPYKRRLVEEPQKKKPNAFDRTIKNNYLIPEPESIDFESMIKKNTTSLQDIEERMKTNVDENLKKTFLSNVRIKQKNFLQNEMQEDIKQEEKGSYRPTKYLGKMDKITKPKN